MGVESRKPPLPAPTESSTLQTSGGSGEEADLATDISRRTDKTSYSIPEDGSPITLPVKKRRDRSERGSSIARDKSQTSLLIEYFEGGKGPNVHSRPSVRVKVTPSAARKIKDQNTNEHIQVTERKGSRKPSYTRRISIGPHGTEERRVSGSGDDKSISSYTSAAEESSLVHRYPPVEVEIMHRDQGSDISGLSEGREEHAREERYVQINPSEISSMPPDSMLDGKAGSLTPKRNRSRSVSRDGVVTMDTLKTPSRRRSRSLSKERLAHKVMEKIAARPREISSGKHKRSSKTRSRSVSSEQIAETFKNERRKSGRKHREEEVPSGAESSVLTTGDQHSFRSGTSKSSINANPRLLETVENAIRRLIMPELETLKQEQKMQQSRQKFERDSRGSIASSSSRGEITRKLSKHASAPDVSGKPKVYLNKDENNAGTLLSGDSVKGRKESRRDRKTDSPSERRSEREMSEETVIRDGEKSSRKGSGHRLRDAAAGGIAGGILTAAALHHHELKHRDSASSVEKRRRKRRSSKSHSRSASIAESTEDAFYKHDVPPMPMQSDIHSSELTRDSILSERTEGTMSPSEKIIHTAEIRQVSRGSPREVLSPASRTPTRSPSGAPRGLGTYHSNLSREYINENSPRSHRSFRDEEDHHSKMAEAGVMGAVAGAGVLTAQRLADRQHHYDSNEYSSYQHDNRGLSPIQSVSSRQESELNRESFHHKASVDSLSSVKRHGKKGSSRSLRSLGSPVSVDMTRTNRPKGINKEPPEEVLAQLQDFHHPEGEYSDKDRAMDEWLEQEHKKNESYRDSSSYRDSMVDYKHMTNYTDESFDAPPLDQVTAAQERQTISGARNPDYVHTPLAVESAVASLIDTSTVSMRSKDNADFQKGERVESAADREIYEGSLDSRDLHREDLQSSRQGKSQDHEHITVDRSPRQSIAKSLGDHDEHVQMGASGLPRPDDPMPEIGHNLNSDSDISTNPSIIQGPMGGYQSDNLDHWPNKATPPHPKASKDSSAHESLKAAAKGFLSAAAIASQGNSSPEKADRSRDLSMKDGYQPQFEDSYDVGTNHDLGHTHDSYMSGYTVPSPPKDEGYQSGPQRGPHSPEISFNNANSFNDKGMGGMADEDDPFVGKGHNRHLSTNSHGLAHGMGSPIYDSATGTGIDRIQSKDIVALMDHVCITFFQRVNGADES